MAILPIVLYPDPVLLRSTEPVERVDDEIRELVGNMAETMHNAPGIGLAANQVGISKRIFLADLSCGEDPEALNVFINPEIQATVGREVGEEGCLSFPDVTLDVERAEEVTVEFLDLEGHRTVITATGLLARVILHESEHLEGKVFLNNISSLRRELVKREIRKRIRGGDWVEAGSR